MTRTHLALAALLSAASCLSAAAPWDKQYADGVAVWHLDAEANDALPAAPADQPALTPHGQAALDRTQKVTGEASLKLAGGRASAAGVSWPGGDWSFEMMVKLAALPPEGQRACLVEANDPATRRPQLVVTVDHRGVLRVEYAYQDHQRFRFTETGVLEGPSQPIKPGEWTHVHVCYIGGVQLMVRLSVNGEIVEEEFAGNGWPGGKRDLIVGGRAGGGEPISGWVDEIRVARDNSAARPLPPDDWTDPQARRPLFDDPACFPARADLTLYAPLDGNVAPAIAAGSVKYEWANVQARVREEAQADKRSLEPRFAPGVRGQALELGCPLDYFAEGNLQAQSGAVAFWFRYPENIKSIGSVLKLGGWGFLLSGNNGMMIDSRYGPLKVRGRAGGGGWWNLGNTRADRWNHVVISWRGEWVDAFVNGTWRQSFLVNGGLAPLFEVLGKRLTVGLGDNWAAYSTSGPPAGWVDEYMLFGRYVTEEQAANLYRWGRGEKPAPALAKHSRITPLPGERKIVIDVDQTLEGIRPGQDISARLVGPDGQTVCSSQAAEVIQGWAGIVLQFPLMPAGDYTVQVTQGPANGKPIVHDSFVYHHADHEWLRKPTGVDERVLPPWTPVRAGADSLEVWNRKFHLGGSALPARIDVGGQPLLASAMRLELQRGDGEVTDLASAPAGLRKLPAAANRAEYSGSAASDELAVEVRNVTEYDGCARLSLRLKPGARPAPVRRLTLVIPIRNAGRLLMNAMADTAYHGTTLACAVPEKPGRVFASYILPACSLTTTDPLKLLDAYDRRAKLLAAGKPLPDELKRLAERTQEVSGGNFIPYLWVGTPDAGLCWFADTDEGWIRGDQATPAVEIRRLADGTAELRLNLIASTTTLRQPREITFGLLPTPARPLPPGWRSRYWQRPTTLGFTTNWPSGRSYLGHGCLGAYWGEPYPMDWDRARWYADYAERQDAILTPYMESIGCDPVVVPPYMEHEWRRQPIDDYYRFFPADSSLVDWFAWHFDRYVRSAGLDGAYWDCIYLLASMGIQNHGAWRDPNGDMQSSYYFWTLREMYCRYRTVLLDAGVRQPWIQVHETGTNKAPAFAYIDAIYDGEGLYQPPDSKKDFIDCWSLDRLTACNNAHTLGVPTRFLGHIRQGSPQEWDAKHALGGYQGAMRAGIGACLLVDCFHDAFGWPMGDIRNAMFRWGVGEDDCNFVGHWRDTFRSSDPNVKVSAWTRPGTVMLLLVNYSRAPVEAKVRFDPEGLLGYDAAQAQCEEIETKTFSTRGKMETVALHDLQCSLSSAGRQWNLSAQEIPPHDFRLVGIWREGNRPNVQTPRLDVKPPVGLNAQAVPLTAQPAKPNETPALIAAMAKDQFAYREQPVLVGATARLAATGSAAVEPLLAALKSPDSRLRANAARALGAVRDARAAAALARLLDDDLWRVRICAQRALEQIGERAVPALVTFLKADRAFAREHALIALGHIHSPAAVDALLAALDGDRDGYNRSLAAWALGEIGDARARDALAKAVAEDKGFAVAPAARKALTKIAK